MTRTASSPVSTSTNHVCDVQTSVSSIKDGVVTPFVGPTLNLPSTGVISVLDSPELKVQVVVVQDSNGKNVINQVVYTCVPSSAQEVITAASLGVNGTKDLVCATVGAITVSTSTSNSNMVNIDKLTYSGNQATGGLAYIYDYSCSPRTSTVTVATLTASSPASTSTNHVCDVQTGVSSIKDGVVTPFVGPTLSLPTTGTVTVVDSAEMKVQVVVVRDSSNKNVVSQVVFTCISSGAQEIITASSLGANGSKDLVCASVGAITVSVSSENPHTVNVDKLTYSGTQATGGLAYVYDYSCSPRVSITLNLC
ncbi:hypothetical protein HDU99_009376 [Rhizoclosmatium hyalinum]|nr:hypothetical protein HDU99_009376 [Rhizoclosmatium hyalinum]